MLINGLNNLKRNEMKQTAVEWLFEKLDVVDSSIMFVYFEQAKEIEKEQMLNVFQESRLVNPMIGLKHETFLDYYNETFKKK